MNMGTQKLVMKSLTLVLSASLLGACSMEKDSDRKIAAGMACVDEARTWQQADACLQKVEGLESTQSYLIRCSANMIAQGFTGGRLAKSVQELKDNNGNKTAAMMAHLVFAKSLANHSADATLRNCTASGVNSVTFLATMIKTATFAAELVGGGLDGSSFDPESPSFNPTALQTQLTNMANNPNPQNNATVGALAMSAQSSYCGNGTSMANQDVCQKLNSAVSQGAGNTESVGALLLGLLKN